MHVRDDAGHASIVTTEGYSDVEMKDRYRSAKRKTIDVQLDVDDTDPGPHTETK